MLILRLALSLSLLIVSSLASANDILAQQLLKNYLHGLEGGMRAALSAAENGSVSLNQLRHLNQTIMRTSVRTELPNIVYAMYSTQIKDPATFKAVLAQNEKNVIRGVDLVVNRAYEMLDNYYLYAQELKTIGFKTPKAYTADGEIVHALIKQIDVERASYRLPEMSRDLLSSNAMKHIVDANYFISKTPSGAKRLSAYLGKDYVERLIQNFLRAAI